MMTQMTIGQLAAAAAVNVETVRYYQRRGLLAMPERTTGSIARYAPATLTRLRFIRRSQALGFSLDDVQALLSLDDGQACAKARRIGEHKLADVQQRIRTLQTLEAALKDLVGQCSVAQGKVACPLIETLMQDERV
ncbi:MAG: MerR family DNA-binding protein [Proteobacteria bacterium]|nr:MerR family DNA-binding protein [Pseudomonadota bacterium]